MKKRQLLVCSLMLVLAMVLVIDCSSAEKAVARTISIATGGSGGAYFAVGGGIAKLVEKYMPNTKMLVQSTAASTENTRLVGTKKVSFAICMPDSAYFGIRGEREFTSEDKYENLRAVMAGHTSEFQPVVLKKSGIKSIPELKGKRIAVGAPASSTVYGSIAILEAYGLKEGDYKPVFLSYNEMVDALKNGAIDCGIINAAAPTASVLDLASTFDIRILGMEESLLDQELKKYPYYTKCILKAGTYKGQDEDLWLLKNPTILMTYAEMDEEIVYNMIKTITEHVDELGAVHPAGFEWGIEGSNEGLGIPLHPGAEKFLKEKGIIK